MQALIDAIQELNEERKRYEELRLGSDEWRAAIPLMAAQVSRLADLEKSLAQLQGES